MFVHQGYFSLVQYCPDSARLESVNVGVVLFCPILSFLDIRLQEDPSRVSRVFKRWELRPWTIEAATIALADRLRSANYRPRDLAEFQLFVNTRGNELTLTQPRPIRVVEPAERLTELFTRLVEEPPKTTQPQSPRSPVPLVLERVLLRLVIERRASRNVKAVVPVLNKQIKCPFAYRNHTMNFILPRRFSQNEDAATDAAMKLAIEGDLLARHGADENGEKRLVVLPEFQDRDGGTQTRKRVFRVLEEYSVRTVAPEQVQAFADEVATQAGRE